METWPVDSYILSSVFDIGAGITSALGLLGFAVAAWLVWSTTRSRQETKRLEMLPEEDRVKIVDEMLTRYGIDARNLTREQKFQLIREEMHKRDATKRLTLIVIAVSCLLCLTIAAVFTLLQRAADAAVERERVRADAAAVVETAKVSADAEAARVKAAAEATAQDNAREAVKKELEQLDELLTVMVTELSEKGPLKLLLESYSNTNGDGEKAWVSIIKAIGQLEESSKKVDKLMKRIEGGFHYEQLKTFQSMTEAMQEKRSGFDKLKEMSFPLSEQDVEQVRDVVKKMQTLQGAIQMSQGELAAYMITLKKPKSG